MLTFSKFEVTFAENLERISRELEKITSRTEGTEPRENPDFPYASRRKGENYQFTERVTGTVLLPLKFLLKVDGTKEKTLLKIKATLGIGVALGNLFLWLVVSGITGLVGYFFITEPDPYVLYLLPTLILFYSFLFAASVWAAKQSQRRLLDSLLKVLDPQKEVG